MSLAKQLGELIAKLPETDSVRIFAAHVSSGIVLRMSHMRFMPDDREVVLYSHSDELHHPKQFIRGCIECLSSQLAEDAAESLWSNKKS